MRTLTLSVCGALLLTAVSGAQSVSDQLKDRTGQELRPSQSKPSPFALPPGITLAGELSSRDAVAIALWNNLAFQAELTKVSASRADLVDAGQFRNPSVSLLMPVGPKPFESLLAWPIEELFQRGRRIRSAQMSFDVSGANAVQAGLDLSRDVRTAYVAAWHANVAAATLKEAATVREELARLVVTRRNDGEATGIDVRVALAAAHSDAGALVTAVTEAENARTRLRWLLGMDAGVPAFALKPPAKDRAPIPDIAALIDRAMTYRPDLRAAELNVDSRAAKAGWERSRVLTMLAPTLSVKEIGGAGVRTGPGLNLDLPLSRNKGKVSRADEETVEAGFVYAALKAQVDTEVRSARESAIGAEEALKRASEVRKAVDELAELATRSRAIGESSQIEVLEAQRKRHDAVLRELAAGAAVEKSRIELDHAIGRNL